MFATTRRTALIARRLLDNDKTIGIKSISKRCYIVKQNEWTSYCKDIVETYSSSALQNQNKLSSNYSINDAIIDTISTQTDDIKYIKLELIGLNFKMKKLMDILDYNVNEIKLLESQMAEVKTTQNDLNYMYHDLYSHNNNINLKDRSKNACTKK